MGDEDRGGQLPQRVPGAAAPGLPPAAEPERTEPERIVAEPGPRVQPEPRPQPGRPANAGPVAEDEVTEWLGPVGGSRPGTRSRPAPRLRPGQPGPASGGPAAPAPAGRFLALLAVLLVTAFAAGSLAVVAVRHFTRPLASGPANGPANSGASAALPRQEAAVRGEAAAWVDQQVSHGVIVSCDRVMYAALTAHGFPADHLLVLGPASPDPVHAAVVVETAAVRDLFGSSLAAAWAPAVLSSFGSGPAGITVRVIASHGAAAYQTALTAGLAARMTAGAALLKDRRITVPPLPGAQLTSGQVDSRLLLALAALARHQPVSIVQFGNIGSGASAGVPLRFADLAVTGQAAHLARAAYVRAALGYLSTVNPGFRPARTVTVVLPDGQPVLRVEFTAPSPLGASGS